jgi:adenine-specific DNA-methyltransferase
MDVPFKVLEHSYGFDNGKQTETETKSGNKIIHGVNFTALKSLLPEYEGRINCI